ncbi:hypothetical protein [Ectothiorhodospira shaposhnikovii]|uniref:hypothetical protein n=1 Tax=Ectothiorhodospira shaposhnikovii TaxID=1054 RepID=UPI001EE8871C|nr:hypothetical protein [Ectothiorhodospira shaposhnikovii]MCG5514370.1 hypothetical protein [Ectothiorhodospira shaposhnikovii]
MPTLNRFSPSRYRVGLHQEPRGLAMAVLDTGTGQRPRLVDYGWWPGQDIQRNIQTLGDQVRRSHLRKARTHFVLAPSEYACILLEEPRVEAGELQEALRWKLVDALPYPADEAVIDTFPTPLQDKRGGGSTMIQVVAARDSLISERARQVQEAGFRLETVDILEMALRNLAVRRDGRHDVHAVVHVGMDRSLIVVIRDRLLFLTRRLPLGYRQLDQPDLPVLDMTEASSPPTRVSEQRLWDEICRSLEYYERHVAGGGAEHALSLITGFPGDGALVQWMQQETRMRPMSLEDLLEIPPDTHIDPQAHAPLMIAVGGALRLED